MSAAIAAMTSQRVPHPAEPSRSASAPAPNAPRRYAAAEGAPASSRRRRTNSASSASCGARLNSSSVRHASRTSSAAASAPASRSIVASSRSAVERVVVDDGALGADGDDDEVAVPRRQLLERVEQLLALGAPLRAPDPLVGLARRSGRAARPRAPPRSRAATPRSFAPSSRRAAASHGANAGSV